MNPSAIVSDPSTVTSRLADFGVSKSDLIEIAEVASRVQQDATDLMPSNAAGTLSYIYGTQEMRLRFGEVGYRISRDRGVESAVCQERKFRIVFQNVDEACSYDWEPHPRSAKGSGSEAICGPDLWQAQNLSLDELPTFSHDQLLTYFIMVDSLGGVELSSAEIKHGKFSNFAERIFVWSGTEDDWDSSDAENGDEIEEFEPVIRRKKR